MIGWFLIFCLLRWHGEKQAQRADQKTGQLKSFFWAHLTLVASPLHPTAPSIQGKASPASLPSQLGAPAGMRGLQVWHLLQHLAGLQKSSSSVTNEKISMQRNWLKR